ncbi:mitochondrial basic amino acids transporter-like [Lineus longissimus]|uniref:mitochondrial basic amino acids transporter-like n=1 Tax=Lineus longissimus TaxID=88925 RepID=UPI002B4C69E6
MENYIDFIAGCFGGCAAVIVGHPFDTVKVRLQTQSPGAKLYRGTFDCFRKIVQKETAHGLYRGMASPLYGLAFINAVVFGVQGNVSRRLTNPNTLTSQAISGASAGFVQSFICSPMELAKTRVQVQGASLGEQKFKGPFDCLCKMYKAEGVKSLFRGLTLTICREIPGFSSYFVCYKYLCDKFSPVDPKMEKSIYVMLFAGGFAGVFSWISTYPIDLVKSRIQADGVNARPMYSGAIDCIKKSYNSEGPRGFFRGINSTLLRAFPVNAVTFVTVEIFLEWAKVNNDDNLTLADVVQESAYL